MKAIVAVFYVDDEADTHSLMDALFDAQDEWCPGEDACPCEGSVLQTLAVPEGMYVDWELVTE